MGKYTREVLLSGRSPDELYDFVSKEIENFLKKLSLNDYKIDYNPSDKTIFFKAKMVSATLFCEPEKLRLDGELSVLATPFRSKIDQAIDRWLEKSFGKPT